MIEASLLNNQFYKSIHIIDTCNANFLALFQNQRILFKITKFFSIKGHNFISELTLSVNKTNNLTT